LDRHGCRGLSVVKNQQTLEELEGDTWGEPTFDSHVVTRCLELRKIPIGELRPEDLRLLIGQGIGLDHVIPLALEHLENDPLTHGDFYPGDLLMAVLAVDPNYWNSNPDSVGRLYEVAIALESHFETLKVDLVPLLDAWRNACGNA